MVILYFVVGLIVSTITLTVSMILFANYWGLDFGEAKTAIAKGAGLVLAVNLMSFIPLGCFVNLLILLVWFVGLMILFQIGLLEAFLLTVVNFVINFLLILGLTFLLGPSRQDEVEIQGSRANQTVMEFAIRTSGTSTHRHRSETR